MCDFFSFSVTKDGKVLALLGAERMRYMAQGQNPDSHSLISEHFKVNEDDTFKFEIGMNAEDVKKLAEAPLTFETVEELEKYYDGGIDFKLFPLEGLSLIQNWLKENQEQIVEAGKLKFGATLQKMILLNKPASFVIELSYARTLSRLEEEIINGQPFTKSTRSKPGWWLSSRIFPDVHCYFKIPGEHTGEELVAKIFIRRYYASHACLDKDGNPVKRQELRILVTPIEKIVKEGETL